MPGATGTNDGAQTKTSWLELFDMWLQERALVHIMDKVGKFAILVAAATWGYDYTCIRPVRETNAANEQARLIAADHRIQKAEERWAEAEERRLVADSWRAIYQAVGKAGDGGRFVALEELCRRKMDLSRMDLRFAILRSLVQIGEKKKWVGIDLSYAMLREANFSGADLEDARLGGADLVDVNFSGAWLTNSDLRRSDMHSANFSGADLRGVQGITILRIGQCYWDKDTDWPKGFLERMKKAGLPEERLAPPKDNKVRRS